MKRVVVASIRDIDYYGQSAARKYGDQISSLLSGQKVKTSPRDSKTSGGLKFEAKHLGIPYKQFEEALIGMSQDGRVLQLAQDEYLVR